MNLTSKFINIEKTALLFQLFSQLNQLKKTKLKSHSIYSSWIQYRQLKEPEKALFVHHLLSSDLCNVIFIQQPMMQATDKKVVTLCSVFLNCICIVLISVHVFYMT